MLLAHFEMADYQGSTFSPHGAPASSVRTPAKRALYRNQDETINSTSYQDYPTNKPFINDDYRRNSSKPPSAFPESNRSAVISALKNLQEKVRKLELERGAAENNLKSLAAETIRYKDILQKEHENDQPIQSTMSKHTQELETQLSSAETRCNLLEKQLDYMKKMVQNAEVDRQEAVARTSILERKQEHQYERANQENIRRHEFKPPPQFSVQAEKINELEREHLKLTATQALAENKIRELESKLQEEQHHRKMIENKAAELESVAQSSRILMQAGNIDEPVPKAKKTKKKKKVVPSKKPRTQPPPDYGKHYRLNLAEIPFVAGKSSTPSHSVGANVQRVLSLMKSHNLALCTALNHVNGQRSPSSSSGSSSGSVNNDLADILLQLQDEFGRMSFEHQELSRQINEVKDPRLRDDLERELDSLVTRMEAKSQQISKLRRNQVKLVDKKKKKVTNKNKINSPESTPRSKSASGSTSSYNTNGEVEVTTTIKTKGNTGKVHIRPTSAREVSLNVLKDMKKLQTTLRKDDVCWE